jgi:FAD/FMN-containing dehydrogenase
LISGDWTAYPSIRSHAARTRSGHRYLADTFLTNSAAADFLPAIGHHLAMAPSRKSLLLCVFPPSPPAGAPPSNAALSISAQSFVLCYAVWDDAAADEANHAWHRTAVDLLEPFAVGHYIGESDIAARPGRARHSFAPESWQRLQALRNMYDPDRRFYAYFDEPA